MTDLDGEVRAAVYRFLEGDASIDDFEEWFVGHTWDDRTALIAEVDHLLAEKDSIDPDLLTRELADLVTTIRHLDVPALVKTSTSTTTVRVEQVHLGRSQTIRRRLQFAGT